MKTAEAKPADRQAARSSQPFFNKGGHGMFSNEMENNHPSFFSSQKNSFFRSNNTAIQSKLTVGQPNDKYEREADTVADKVVQRLSKNKPSFHSNTEPQAKTVPTKPLAAATNITPLIQAKQIPGEHEEKLQKKEEEIEPEPIHGKLQKKPIFESNAEPPDDPRSFDKRHNKALQRKCAACEGEEKLQKKEKAAKTGSLKTNLQRKPVFESNALPEDRLLQKKCASCEKEENLQKQENNGSAQTATPSVESSLSSSKNSGTPLPQSTRRQMESSFGADFSGVRIHNDSRAAQISDEINAQAFTHGRDIYFNSGKYDPGSSDGKHLLAHELTHTMQQGASVQRKETPAVNADTIQKAAAPAKSAPVSSEVVDISKGTFNPSEKVKGEIEAVKNKTELDVRIKAGAFAADGLIKVRKKGDTYDSIRAAYLPLTNAWLQKVPGLVLRIDVKNNQVTGFVTGKVGSSDVGGWLNEIKKVESEIGMGFHFKGLPAKNNIVNKLENGTLSLGFKDFTITLGGFFDLNLNLTLENMNTPVFDGSATMTLKGAEGKVNVDNKYKGKLGGSGSLTVTGFKGFSGVIEVKYDAETGALDIHGKAEYSGDKLSGSIELVSTDEQTANNFTKEAIKAAGGKENVQDAAPPAPVPAPTGTKKRALAGVGQLQFNLTDWFAGTVNVVVDGVGHITVIGKIAPPAEIVLFKQKDWDKELFKFEAKAYYGIPVVGNLNLFANISLHAIAKLGPAKIYNIEILGTYSTDPEVQKNIQIAGSINISAYAGLRLRAEGGAGIEILSHDLKFGVGVQADVGVEAYADARPTIGWRDPGQFFISGTLEMVAQPMLALGGDFFIQIETPWWSPLSDKKWTWPLFAKQWPLTDPIGINATLKDYVLGSGNVPEVELKKPEFDPSKFMTNMVDNNLPDKAGEGGKGQGAFKEDGSVKPPEVPDKKKGKADADQKGKSKGKKDAPAKAAKSKTDPKADAEAVKLFDAGGKQLKSIKDPITKADLRDKLNGIEKAVNGIKYDIQLEGDKWLVSSTAKGIKNPKAVKFKAIVTDADKKGGNNEVIKIHETFETEGEKHELNTKAGTNELIMSSSNQVLLNNHPDKGVRDAYEAYLQAIKIAKSPTEKKEKANEKIVIIVSKIKAAKMSSAPGASAPGIGTIDMHKNQQSKLRRSKIEVWFMESEHVIPRAFISNAFEALAQVGIPAGGADYNNMHTILIYKGAANVKTSGEGDLSLINHFKGTVKEIRDDLFSNPNHFTQALPELADVISNLLSGFAHDAKERTKEAIKEENKKNGALRGPQNKPEPPIPEAGKIDHAYDAQKTDLNNQLNIRFKAFIENIKKPKK